MAGLMHYCKSWGDENCHPDVKKFFSISIENEAEGPSTLPTGKALKVLDDICLECKNRFLVAKKKVCPYCDSSFVLETGGSHQVKGYVRMVGFQCEDCKTKFWMAESNITP